MGISTFLHLLTDAEAEIVKQVPDNVISSLCVALCERPHVVVPESPFRKEDSVAAAADKDDKRVNVLTTLNDLLLKEEAKNDPDNTDTKCYLEVGTKFWSAEYNTRSERVTVRYGKKGTSGSTNTDQGRAYFEKKRREKLKKGYRKVNKNKAKINKSIKLIHAALGITTTKDKKGTAGGGQQTSSRRSSRLRRDETDDDVTATAAAAPKKKQKLASSSSATASVLIEEPFKDRADLDKCGSLATYMAGCIMADKILNDDDNWELLEGIVKTTEVGNDVSYGCAYFASSADVSELNAKLQKITRQDVEDLDMSQFPESMGSVFDVRSTEKDSKDYFLYHFLQLQAIVKSAHDTKCGLLVHFW